MTPKVIEELSNIFAESLPAKGRWEKINNVFSRYKIGTMAASAYLAYVLEAVSCGEK